MKKIGIYYKQISFKTFIIKKKFYHQLKDSLQKYLVSLVVKWLIFRKKNYSISMNRKKKNKILFKPNKAFGINFSKNVNKLRKK
jgi:hypothetical protein